MKNLKNKKSVKQNFRNRLLNLKYKLIIKSLLKSLKTKEISINPTVIAAKLKKLSKLVKYLDKSGKKKVFHKNTIVRKKKLAYKIFGDFLKKVVF